jgi:predicted transglutaminase-like cysteine proteinase
MDSSTKHQGWTSSILKKLGAVETVVPSPRSSKIKTYCTALLLAAGTALAGLTAAPVLAENRVDMRTEQAIVQVNTQPGPATLYANPILGRRPVAAQDAPGIRLANYHGLMDASKDLPRTMQIKAVNSFFNHNIGYKSDREAWGRDDYWATPLETMTRGVGDCEDFAIAKYYALAKLGVPADQMRITYVKSSGFSEAHMVLAVYPGKGEPLILDNMVDRLAPLSQRTDLSPVYSFNGQGLYLPSSKTLLGGTERLSKWQAVIDRVSREVEITASVKSPHNPMTLQAEQSATYPKSSHLNKRTVPAKASIPDYS